MARTSRNDNRAAQSDASGTQSRRTTRRELRAQRRQARRAARAARRQDDGKGGQGTQPRRATRARRVSRIWSWFLVLGGLALLAWPVATDWYFAWQAEQSIAEIVSVYDDMSDPDRLENVAQAQGWNARLRGENPGIELWDYRYQLTYRSTPESMMAWLDVAKIRTRLAIYHGTGEAELMAGVGHCEWSALPVGGEGTHCVLTAHSGMQGTRMFDDIRRLVEGDTFVVWALGEPYAYRVCAIGTYLPTEAVDHLMAEPGRDLCTLVTCTPYGINTHRLLVTGERCEYTEDMDSTTGLEQFVNSRTLPLLAAIAVVLAAVIVAGLIRLKRHRAQIGWEGHNPYAPPKRKE